MKNERPIPQAGGLPEGPEKRREILQAAKLQFLETGFEATSMDAVAARAGTTKRTVYAYFQNKDALYLDVADYAASLFVGGIPELRRDTSDVAGEIAGFCAAVLANLAWGDAVKIQQMVIGSRSRFPALAPRLYEASFGVAAARLSSFLRDAKIVRRDVDGAAHELLHLTTGRIHMETLMGAREPLPGPPGPETYAAIDIAAIRKVVRLYLAGSDQLR